MIKEVRELQIAIVGLALSHPYTFTGILLEQGVKYIHVWDTNSSKLESFKETYPSAIVHESFEELLECHIDGAVICTESYLHPSYSIPLLKKGVPTCIDKAMVVNSFDMEQLLEALTIHQTPTFSSSILRFSPDFVEIKETLSHTPIDSILSAEAKVFHSIEGFLKEGNTWQDELDKGGGTLLNMGVHGIELLYTCIGSGVSKVWATTEKRFYKQTQSEDLAMIYLKYKDGKTASVQLICGTNFHSYNLDVFTHERHVSVQVPDENRNASLVSYGYSGMMDAFIDMVLTGKSPVPLSETIEIMQVLFAARQSAKTAQWVDISERTWI